MNSALEAQLVVVVPDMNEEAYVQEVPYDSAFAFLPDAELENIDSYSTLSVYSFRCGCAVVRFVDFEDCRAKWCRQHRLGHRLHSVQATPRLTS